MLRLTILFVFSLTLGLSLPAHAASFDCAKASTPFEHAICDNPELSEADELLAKTYATAIGGLSEAALSALRADQRTWLDFAQRACTKDAEPLAAGRYDEDGVRCLANIFSGRSGTLEASRMMSGLRFYPRARFASMPDPNAADYSGSAFQVAKHELSYVQLDGDDAFATAFNAYVEGQAKKLSSAFETEGGWDEVEDAGTSDSDNSITVDRVTSNRISLDVGTYWYGHGAAHGNWTQTHLHFLVEEQRPLVAADIFSGKRWQKALLDLAVEALEDQHGDMLFDEYATYIAEPVADPQRWDLSNAYGLVIQFQPYEVAAYAYGAPTVTIRWDLLEPYLAEGVDRLRY